MANVAINQARNDNKIIHFNGLSLCFLDLSNSFNRLPIKVHMEYQDFSVTLLTNSSWSVARFLLLQGGQVN